MKITAEEAYMIVKENERQVDAWDKLFSRIKEEAENANYILVFDEEKENVNLNGCEL